MQWLKVRVPRLLTIDGVTYKMPQWLDVGTSIFLPSLNHKKTMQQVRKHYAPYRWTLRHVERIEGGILGVRVWRVA